MKPVDYSKDGNERQDVSKDWFVGEPILKDLSGMLEINESKIFHVTFPNGAKTKLHFHQGGQLLIVTEGVGNLVIFKKLEGDESKFSIEEKEIIELKKGSIQYIPAKILHTHGSIDGETLSHIAINYPASEVGKEYQTVWYESDFKHQVTEKL